MFILYFKKGKHFFTLMLTLSYSTIMCNTHEYKKMDTGLSRGQLYEIQNEINMSEKLGSGLLIYYGTRHKRFGMDGTDTHAYMS